MSMILPRPLYRIGCVTDGIYYMQVERPAPSYVIFVNHNLLDAVVFAKDFEDAKRILMAIFYASDGTVEVYISPCSPAGHDGSPVWVA